MDVHLMTVSEAARYLEVGEDRVRRLERAGLIKCQRTNRNGVAKGWRLFDPKELKRYKDRQAKVRR